MLRGLLEKVRNRTSLLGGGPGVPGATILAGGGSR
jgi:hypothetical protein